MKRLLRGAWMFIAIMGFGTLGLFMASAQRLAPAKTGGGGEKIVAFADLASLPLASAAIARLKIDPEQPWDKYVSPSRYDREVVEVLSRSITFPEVLYIGDRLISGEYPNATILCLDAVYYAGKAQGLIWAMDRDTVMEHELEWTIDNADALSMTCATILLREAVADKNVNHKKQLEDVKQILSGQVRLIQEALRTARDVKISAHEGPRCGRSTRASNNRPATDVFGVGQP